MQADRERERHSASLTVCSRVWPHPTFTECDIDLRPVLVFIISHLHLDLPKGVFFHVALYSQLPAGINKHNSTF